MDSMTVDTDHGVYDAHATRPADGAPAGSILTVFCEDGALAGFVTRIPCGRFGAVVPGAHGSLAMVREMATVAGAVNEVAARDTGITRV